MKCKYIILWCLLVATNNSIAQQINLSTAIETASAFFDKPISANANKIISQNGKNAQDTNIVKCFIGKNGICLYGINMEKGGWALVSADQRIRPILAYSETGFLPEWDSIHSPLQELIQSYIFEIEYAQDSIIDTEIHPEWIKSLSLSSIPIVVDNLLQKVGNEVWWNQQGNQDSNYGHPTDCDKVYNKFCPTFTSQPYQPCDINAYAGCVAVAMGQIMWYWQWPYYAQVPLIMKDSLGNTSGTTMHQYDWNKMPYELNNYSDQKDVNMIATLLRDCGYSVNMQYRANGSFSSITTAATALNTIFGYRNSTRIERPTEGSKQEEWITILENELDNYRPILYRGANTNNSGHAYVLSGYNSADYFYVNWGYGHFNQGIKNAFCSLNNMKARTGIYNSKQAAVIGIEPAPICSFQKPTTQSLWETNIVELYHGDVTIQNKTYNSSSRGIIYADGSIHITGNVHIEAGANVHIAIRDMYCNKVSKSNTPVKKTIKLDDEKEIPNLDSFYITPNPVYDVLNINSSGSLEQVMIYDLNGQCIITTSQTTINVSHFQSGLYLLRAITLEGTTLQTKFIKL